MKARSCSAWKFRRAPGRLAAVYGSVGDRDLHGVLLAHEAPYDRRLRPEEPGRGNSRLALAERYAAYFALNLPPSFLRPLLKLISVSFQSASEL